MERVKPGTTEKKSAAPLVIPARLNLAELRENAAHCRACDLWMGATQTVFGEGPTPAAIMFVAEQPGDREDIEGHPFVGPAGRVLDEAMAEAGIDRKQAYVTNMVKHFRWVQAERGKRRIHKKPRASQIEACRPWLDAELRVVKPQVLVCLGATAAQGLLGRNFSVLRERGKLQRSNLAPFVLATVHPSSILRSPDPRSRKEAMQKFVADLKQVERAVRKRKAIA